MSTETMERPVAAAPVVALTPQKRAAVALNTAEYEIKLQELLTNSAGILAVKNKAGRDECHTAYMVLKNTRCTITNLSEDATEDAKAFTKAVKAEAARLIAITEKEETRLQALRDAWDDAEQARKDALIAAEKARTESIQAMIQKIRSEPVSLAGKTAGEIAAWLDTENPDKDFDFMEFSDAAADAIAESLIIIRNMLSKAQAAEAATLAAEEARKAEAARIEQERATLAAQRAENERIANEQAVERQRLANLAAAQEAEATRIREKAAANLKAEQEALAEQVRIQREVAAEQQAKLDAQQAEIEAKRAAFAREQEEARQRAEDAAKMEADHAEALIDNATFDDAMTRLAAVDTPTFHVSPSDDLARCTATAQAMLTNGRSLVQADVDPMQFSVAAYEDAGLDKAEEPFIDYEAIAWAYKKLLAFGVGNGSMDNAMMLDRLNLMLLTAEAA